VTTTLHVVPIHGEPFEHPLEDAGGDSLVVGRASDADLVIEDRFLSRHHTRFFRQGRRWMVEDLGSRNGTLLNGRPVREPVAVTPGDVVRISGSVVTVRGDDEPQARLTSSELGDHTILKSASGLLSDAESRRFQDEEALRRYADRLRLLNEVHRALGESIELGELLDLILERVFDHLRPEQGAIFLRRENGDLECAKTRSLPGVDSDLFYSRSLAREVTEKGMAALVIDVESDERFSAVESILLSGVRSLVAAPLLDRRGALGMIVLSSRTGARRFSEEDMELLVSLASVAALALRNVALAEEAAERRRMQRELTLGRRIQMALLPDRLPEVAGYQLLGRNVPSRGVSGDYFVVLEREGGAECVLMVADVSGKGIAASLLTASLEALAAGPLEDGRPPEEICRRLSRLLYRRTPPERYATVLLAILEPATGRLCYANAGHNAGLLIRTSGEVVELRPTGMPIGLTEDADYHAGEAALEPGDLLVLYTDGITEALDPDDEEYGLPRLRAFCVEHRGLPLEELATRLEADLDRFARGVPFADDRTLVMARRAE